MAARAQSGGGGLSVQTLLIAALASGGAAVIVSNLWESGTVMAAAITPVIVSLLREAVLPKAIERPARAVASVRTARRTAGFSAVGATTGAPTAENRAGETAATPAGQAPAPSALAPASPGWRTSLPGPTGSTPAVPSSRTPRRSTATPSRLSLPPGDARLE